jgi:hypothetical protein
LEHVKLVAPALTARNIAHWITAGTDLSFVVRRKPYWNSWGQQGCTTGMRNLD